MAPPVIDLTHYDVSGSEFDVRTRLAALEGVYDKKTNFEEEAVGGHIETTHLVEAIVGHHQCNETYRYSFTYHLDVVNNSVDCKFTIAVMLPLILLLPALAHAEGIMCEVRLSSEDVELIEEAG